MNGQWAASRLPVLLLLLMLLTRANWLVPMPITEQSRVEHSTASTQQSEHRRLFRFESADRKGKCDCSAQSSPIMGRQCERANGRAGRKNDDDDGDGDVTVVENGVDFNRQRKRKRGSRREKV